MSMSVIVSMACLVNDGVYTCICYIPAIPSYVGGACRKQVFRKLCHEFVSPVEADQHFHELDTPLQQLQSTVTTTESQQSIPTEPEQHSQA